MGFKTVRPHPRFPRVRLELRTALSWKSDVEYALEKLLGSMTPDAILRPATRGMLTSGTPADRATASTFVIFDRLPRAGATRPVWFHVEH